VRAHTRDATEHLGHAQPSHCVVAALHTEMSSTRMHSRIELNGAALYRDAAVMPLLRARGRAIWTYAQACALMMVIALVSHSAGKTSVCVCRVCV